jgi:predicted transcriptional regulator
MNKQQIMNDLSITEKQISEYSGELVEKQLIYVT